MNYEQILAVCLGVLHGLLNPSILWWGMSSLRNWKWPFYLKHREAMIPVLLLLVLILPWAMYIASASGTRWLAANYIDISKDFPKGVTRWWAGGFCGGMFVFIFIWRITNRSKKK